MRLNSIVVSLGLLGVGCGSPQGASMKQHAGSIRLVFTNASPDTMCELRMAFDQSSSFGDNWLAKGGLASGASKEFNVKPGKYRATWSTCQTVGKSHYAATMTHRLAFTVDKQTQLFAYIADVVAPTSRAPMLGRDYQLVRFQGQAIAAIAPREPQGKVDAFAALETELQSSMKSDAQPAAEDQPSAVAKAEKPTKQEKFNARDVIDPKAKQRAKGANRAKAAKQTPATSNKAKPAAR